jgi:hypothetical protein
MIWAGHVAGMRNMINTHNNTAVKSVWTRPIGMCVDRRKDNIKMNLKDILCGGVGWIRMAEG